MMQSESLSKQRCFFHWQREAVARCPECARYYCRECVTEHLDRLLCASCIARIVAPATHKKSFQPISLLLQCLIGFIVLWAVFYYSAQILLAIPSPVHEGTTWKDFVK